MVEVMLGHVVNIKVISDQRVSINSLLEGVFDLVDIIGWIFILEVDKDSWDLKFFSVFSDHLGNPHVGVFIVSECVDLFVAINTIDLSKSLSLDKPLEHLILFIIFINLFHVMRTRSLLERLIVEKL